MRNFPLPPLAPIPPPNIRIGVGSAEWESCLEAWLALVDAYTAVEVQQLRSNFSDLTTFLATYYHEVSQSKPNDESFTSPKAESLKKSIFKLSKRIVLEGESLPGALSWDFLADFCHAYGRSISLCRVMSLLWKKRSSDLIAEFQEKKNYLVVSLDKCEVLGVLSDLSKLCMLMRVSPEVAAFFMTGSDFLDALITAYTSTEHQEYKRLSATIVCVGLLALNEAKSKNISLLSDHLYTLKAQAKGPANLLADVVTNTPLIVRLRSGLSGKAADRLFKLLHELETFHSSAVARPRPQRRQLKVNQSKAANSNQDIIGEAHIHRMSVVTQLQDLFPDLGAGFILRLLDEYKNDAEQVTAHLLDDSLPPHLQTADRTESAPIFDTSRQTHIDHLIPGSTPQPTDPHHTAFVPERKNVYDNDNFDRLATDTNRIHIGKKEAISTYDHSPSNAATNKAAILSALAAFDSDDDERDDTYDAEDVGGTIDNAAPEHEETPRKSNAATQDKLDSALFKIWKSSPELFGRSFDIRKSQARLAIKQETELTDEAIEGWAIMLQRDSRRLQRLERDFGSTGGKGGYDGRQVQIERTAWRESSNANTETEDDSDVPRGNDQGSRGRGAGGRGRGRGGRGKGGNVAGPSGDADTVAAQKRKEQNKSSRANHNRRNQRAKKMARGGFAG